MKPRRNSKLYAEYIAPTEKTWRIDNYKEFCKFFGPVHELQLGKFHELAETKHRNGWVICRLLFGINPLVPDVRADAEFLRSHTLQEVKTKLKLDSSELSESMDDVAREWKEYVKLNPFEPPAEPELVSLTSKQVEAALPAATDPVLGLNSEELDLLKLYGFSTNMFDVPDRSDEYRILEAKWFCGRLLELKKAFDQPFAKGIARQALLNEMHLRRADDELSRTNIVSKNFWPTHDTKLKIEERYSQQWKDLEEACPFVKAAEGRINFVGTVTDLIEAIKSWEANGDNKLIHGLRTAYELQVELRQSVQAEVRLRPGWESAMMEAKENLWNPKYKRKITNYQCKMMDVGFRAAIAQLNDACGVRLPDLERSDASGEYEKLVIVSLPTESEEVTEDIEAPAQNVEIGEPVVDAKKQKKND